MTPGGIPPALDLSLAPQWHPRRSILVRTFITFPLASPNVVSTEGQATISTWLAGAAVDWRVHSRDGFWTATLGAGGAAAWSRSTGSARAPYVSSSASAIAAVPFVEVGGLRGLGTQRVRLGLDGMLGMAIPEVAIQFAGQQVAAWGLPVVTMSLALEIDLL